MKRSRAEAGVEAGAGAWAAPEACGAEAGGETWASAAVAPARLQTAHVRMAAVRLAAVLKAKWGRSVAARRDGSERLERA